MIWGKSCKGGGVWNRSAGEDGKGGEDLKDSKDLAFHQQPPAGQKLVRKQH